MPLRAARTDARQLAQCLDEVVEGGRVVGHGANETRIVPLSKLKACRHTFNNSASFVVRPFSISAMYWSVSFWISFSASTKPSSVISPAF